MSRFPLALIGLATFSACTRTPSPVAEPFIIGVVSSLTGPGAPYGVAMRQGVELAVAEIAGLSPKISVNVVFADDQSHAPVASQVTQRLVTEQGARLVIGSVSTVTSQAVAEAAARAEVPVISPSSTDPLLTRVGPRVFRACFADPLQAEVMAKFARARMGIERVGIVRDADSTYSQNLSRRFREVFEGEEGTVAFDLALDDAGASLRDALVRSDAQAIYLPLYADKAVIAATVIEMSGKHAVLLGGDSLDVARLLKGQAAFEGAHLVTHFAVTDPRAEVQRFALAYRARYNEAPDAAAALGYDAARLSLKAIRSQPSDLGTALAETSLPDGVTGPIELHDREAPKRAVIIKVIGGTRTYVSAYP